MTLLIECLKNCAAEFDHEKYPFEVYLYLLNKISSSQSPDELGDFLSQAIAWKDGKVSLDDSGEKLIEATGIRYSIKPTKPNTLSRSHEDILRSHEFFNWALVIRNLNYFDAKLIQVINNRFKLWSTIVLPAFLLHCLKPDIYPILDRWVLNAFSVFENNPSYKSTNVDNYIAYQKWWDKVLAEANIGSMLTRLDNLKEIDAGLWVLGKRFSSDNSKEEDHRRFNPELRPTSVKANQIDTGSKEFKRRAFDLYNSGLSQAKAIEHAANEMKVDLRPWYIQYPGSHFDRWRKQGYQ